MGKCIQCDCETQHTALVYLGEPTVGADGLTNCQFKPHREFLCEDCVEQYSTSGGKTSMLFYLALQMCWLTVIKSGLTSPVGIFAAVVAIFAAVRLATLLVKLVSRRSSSGGAAENRDADASDLCRKLIRSEQSELGNAVLSLREYNRKYRKE